MSESTGTEEHWDGRYRTVGADQVSWFQQEPTVSMRLLAECGVARTAGVIDVGGGASTFVDALLREGWTDLTVLDLSAEALATARARVGQAAPVEWITHDLLTWAPSRTYGVWHDRAVFHFLTSEADRARYREQVRTALEPGGLLVVGTFAKDGPTECSGLLTSRYDTGELIEALGSGFSVVTTTGEVHRTPWESDQAFSWVALRRGMGPSPT